MDWNQMLAELDVMYASLNKISNAIASVEGITDNPEWTYLEGKLKKFGTTWKHVEGQAKSKKAEQRKQFKRK